MKKLFVFDIDNTIKPYVGKISKSTIKAFALLNRQADICLASGRCYQEVENLAQFLKVDYCVCSGGLEVFYKGKRIYSKMDDLKEELGCLKKKKPVHLIVSDEGVYSFCFPSMLKLVSFFRFEFSKFMTPWHVLGFIKDVKIIDDITNIKNIQKILVFSKYEPMIPYVKTGLGWLSYEGEDKTIGISFLMDLNGYDQLISFGDSKNDRTLALMSTRSYAYKKGDKELIEMSCDTFDLKDGIYRIVLKELQEM